MSAFARSASQIVVAVSIVVAVWWIAPMGYVAACSCEEQYPAVADSIGRADIAFVGRLDRIAELDPPIHEFNYYDVRYELIVEHSVKGVEDGDRVVMFGDVNGGTSCGTSELTPGQDLYAILSNDYDGRFVADSTPPCSPVPSIDELRSIELTLPETSPGPVSVVVVGQLGEAELISYAYDGRPVAYGNLPWRAGQPGVCPGSERLVQIEQNRDELTELVIRELGTLEVVERIELDELDTDAATSVELRQFLVDGAVLECRSGNGGDVVGLLSWENTSDGQTSVVRFDGANGSVLVSVHGKTTHAQHDPFSDDVVGVKGGEFVRIDTNIGNETVVADLLVRPGEADYDAVFVETDDAGGWWIGLGDGEYELATNLRVLVHVDADATIVRWPVQSPPESIYGADVTEGRLIGDGFTLTLPAPGSSTDGAVVTPEITDLYARPLALGDGRSLQSVTGEGVSTVELLAANGDPTTLQHLLQARYAVAVPDGPTVNAGAVDRTFSMLSVESPWITPGGEPAFDSTTTTTIEDPGAALDSTEEPQSAGANDLQAPQEPATTAADSTSSGSDGQWWVVLGLAAVVAVGLALVLLVASRRRTAAIAPERRP